MDDADGAIITATATHILSMCAAIADRLPVPPVTYSEHVSDAMLPPWFGVADALELAVLMAVRDCDDRIRYAVEHGHGHLVVLVPPMLAIKAELHVPGGVRTQHAMERVLSAFQAAQPPA